MEGVKCGEVCKMHTHIIRTYVCMHECTYVCMNIICMCERMYV